MQLSFLSLLVVLQELHLKMPIYEEYDWLQAGPFLEIFTGRDYNIKLLKMFLYYKGRKKLKGGGNLNLSPPPEAFDFDANSG